MHALCFVYYFHTSNLDKIGGTYQYRGVGSSEKLGGRYLTFGKTGGRNHEISLTSNVFEGKKDKIH